ncbi:MAG: hypothetical protein QOE69_3486 [Thermoleophilaceae bacterium]|jgi:hypothetical protein|nr:hypothetical protein [Thermoleophilaceae bacterium]MEA2409367.1 hypothetical protein [Thermoleophilaceae bacterium]
MKGLTLAVLCALALLVPVAAADARTSSKRDQSKVTVDVQIKRFAVADRKIVAHGILTSRVQGAGESKSARKRVTLAVAAQRGRCHVLTLTLDDLQLDLLGLRVDLSEVNLRIFALPRGEGSGVLGRLFCALSRSTIRLGRGASASHAKQVVASLNTRLQKKPMRAFRASAMLAAEGGEAQAAQAAPSCRVLNLILGPLDLNLLGLVVELYGPNRNAPVTLTITSFPGQGALGDLFCSLSGGPQ